MSEFADGPVLSYENN